MHSRILAFVIIAGSISSIALANEVNWDLYRSDIRRCERTDAVCVGQILVDALAASHRGSGGDDNGGRDRTIFCSCQPTTNVHECYVYQTPQGEQNGSRYFMDVPDYDLVFTNVATGAVLDRRRIDCTTKPNYQPAHACEQVIAEDPRCS